MNLLFLVFAAVVSRPDRTPLLDLYLDAGDCIEQGNLQEAGSIVEQIARRMPGNPRALYNAGVASMASGNFPAADSLLSQLPEGFIGEDTLLEARSSARLGAAISAEDYAGVESVLYMLLPAVSSGEATMRMLQNWEVALKWLQQNEPPPPEENPDQEDQEDEQQEQDERQDEQDEQQDEQDEQDEQDDEEENQPPPPDNPEMTPEVARAILDMVEEAQADTASVSPAGVIGAPVW